MGNPNLLSQNLSANYYIWGVSKNRVLMRANILEDTLNLLKVLILITISIVVIGCKDRSSHTEPTSTSSTDLASRNALGDYFDCKTIDGIPVKVIVKSDSARAWVSADFTGNSEELLPFERYFVFDENKQGFRIGKTTRRQEDNMGWVKKQDVERWNTNQAIYFISKEDARSTSANVWLSKDHIGDVSKPHFEITLSSGTTSEPFPVLGRSDNDLEIALLWDIDETLVRVEGEIPGGQDNLLAGEHVKRGTQDKTVVEIDKGRAQQIKEQSQRLDIVIVIDATKSMGPYIAQVRRRLLEIVEGLAKLGEHSATVFVGIVAYRDYGDQFVQGSFTTKALPLTDNMIKVREFLHLLGAKSHNDFGKAEAVWDGLARGAAMSFGGKHSVKLLCLVGDAPPHDGTDRDIEAAREKKQIPDSEYFDISFENGLRKIRKTCAKENIQVISFLVGDDRKARRDFQKIAGGTEDFSLLPDANRFIDMLENKLQEGKRKQVLALDLLAGVVDGSRTTQLSDGAEREALQLVGLEDLSELKKMEQVPVQRGWFRLNDRNAELCVYTSRKSLEDHQDRMRSKLNELSSGAGLQEDVIEELLNPALDRFKWTTIDALLKRSRRALIDPGQTVIPLPGATMEDQVEFENTRKKANQLAHLLVMNGIFNDEEEGWIPLRLLPVGK